jgi:outer membrane lipoprotein SlyB
MKKIFSIKSVSVLCIPAIVSISLLCCPAVSRAQLDWGGKQTQPANPAKPAYTPPPDTMIYFKCGPKEKTVGVTATNLNVPGLPPYLNYLKSTDEALEDIGYVFADRSTRAAISVRVTARYIEVDNSKAVAKEAGGKAAAGAVLGVLGALAGGGGGRDVAQGATGGAADGLASGTVNAPVLRYLTLEFEISSKTGGVQTGQVTRDITDPTLRLEEFIDGAIADYLEASFPKRSR